MWPLNSFLFELPEKSFVICDDHSRKVEIRMYNTFYQR